MQIDLLGNFHSYALPQARSDAVREKKPQIDSQISIEIESAFDKAAALVSELTANDMKHRLDIEEVGLSDAVKRAEALQIENFSTSANDAIAKQNALLASRNLPPMKPAEEQLFRDKIKLMSKERSVFLNSFINSVKNSSIKLTA